MKYIVMAVAMLILSGCFNRDKAPTDVPSPTDNIQETETVVDTGAIEVVTGATDTNTGGSATNTGSLETGFNTKDFSDPEVEEVIDLLEGLLKS